MAGIDQPGDAKPRARSKNDARRQHVLLPEPIGSRLSSSRAAIARACASKSLMTMTSFRPSLASMSFGLTTQWQLVNGISSPSIGPAIARMVETG